MGPICSWKHFPWKKCCKRNTSAPWFPKTESVGDAYGGRVYSSLCSKLPAWHLPSHPMHFTLTREGIRIISQQASEQTLALIWGSLIIKLQHPCMHAVRWVGGRGGAASPGQCASSLVFPVYSLRIFFFFFKSLMNLLQYCFCFTFWFFGGRHVGC